jgi:uncharacterized protein
MRNLRRWTNKLSILLKPHKEVPVLRWTAAHPWEMSKERMIILSIGLATFGLGDALVIASGLGNAPWSVLAQGLAIRLGISIGVATVMVGVGVLTLWIPLRRRIGIGTILNILIISIFIDIGLALFPKPIGLGFEIFYLLIGITLVGLGSALYLSCGLGAGPRDGLMTGLNEKTGIRIGRIRLFLELSVLTLGALLGGTVGLGTALFALLIGQSIAIWLGVVSRTTSR